MNRERIILAYKNYFKDFISSLSDAEARKVLSLVQACFSASSVPSAFALRCPSRWFLDSFRIAERNESFMEKLKQIRRIAAIF